MAMMLVILIASAIFAGSTNEEVNVKARADEIAHEAYLLIEDDLYDDALALCNEAIMLDPEAIDAYAYRARIYSHNKEYEKAMTDANKAIGLESILSRSVPHAWHVRGGINFKQDDYDAAFSDYSTAIKKDPQWSWPYINRGILHATLKNYDKAMKDLDKAVLLDSTEPQAYFNRAVVYGKLGEYDKAVNDYNRTIKLDPAFKPAVSARNVTYVLKYKWFMIIGFPLIVFVYYFGNTERIHKPKPPSV